MDIQGVCRRVPVFSSGAWGEGWRCRCEGSQRALWHQVLQERLCCNLTGPEHPSPSQVDSVGWGQGAGCRKAEEAALLGQHFWEVTATRVCYKIFVFLFCLVFLVYVSETLQGEKGLNISFSHIKRFVPRNLKNSWKSLKRSLVHP